MKQTIHYTGVGSRKTPTPIKMRMQTMARSLARAGVVLRSGGAAGADLAFERGCDKERGPKEIYLPWEDFGDDCERDDLSSFFVFGPRNPGSRLLERAEQIASSVHPAWDNLNVSVQLLHTGNVFQVLGHDLETPSRFLICWTPGGKLRGGTRTALLVAARHRVPCFNLGSRSWSLKEILAKVVDRSLRYRKHEETR